MAKFFIDRPVFAWVIAILIMLAGLLAISKLPVEQYPDIAPPSVSVNAFYTGADAATIENTVTQILEQNLTGLDNLMYMDSSSSSSGSISVTLTFEPGTDPDVAQVQVLNKVEGAKARLPQSVQMNGIRVSKQNSNFLKVLGFYSEDGSMDQTDIADYVFSNVQDAIGRLTGVGSTQLFGAEYAMRIWLNPNKLVEYNLSSAQVIASLQAQNAQVTAGQLGGTPAVKGQELNATITAQSRLKSAEEFKNIILRINEDGSQIRLQDIANVELGASSYGFLTNYNGKPSTGLGVYLGTGANQLDTAKLVDQKMEELSQYFPKGLKYVSPYDTTPFVKLSINNVIHTLFEAIALVVIVMFLFLQNIRATIIPTITVPVVLLGTFAILYTFGYTINTLSMFAMVLAIGLLVDDSIVVIENVERIMAEEKLPAREATRKSMDQITGALVGIALVLSAVFIPMAFFGGATGGIFRQFSITIISAMGLSVVVAIVLTPALCATMLKPHDEHDPEKKKGFFGWFNRTFNKTVVGYEGGVKGLLKRPVAFLFVYAAIIAGLLFSFSRLPTSFLPEEDQGVFITLVQLHPGATQEQTQKVLNEITDYMLNQEENVTEVFTINGFSMAGQGQNAGLAFVKLRDWSLRKEAKDKIDAIIGRSYGFFSTITDAQIFAVNLPAIPALGMANGFSFIIEDVSGNGHEALMSTMLQMVGEANRDPILSAVRPSGLLDVPQFKINVDFEKAQVLGLSLNEINSTLSTVLGSSYVDDFIYNTRVKKVYVQGEAQYRMNPPDLDLWQIKNNKGEMIPLSAFSTTEWSSGSPSLTRYNGYSSAGISGSAAPGKSSGDAMLAMERLAEKLPNGYSFDWTGTSYQERQSGDQKMSLYAISALVVFLCLAALYESWSIPFSVILIVPLGIIGAVLATWGRGLDDDVYFQVGLLTTIGLAAKNAILIVEFAQDSIKLHGKSLFEGTLEACRLRLRPILMTSFAFVFGVIPLAISNGAGSASQNAVGTGVVGGVITATLLTIFFVPLFFVIITKLFTGHKRRPLHNTHAPAQVSEKTSDNTED